MIGVALRLRGALGLRARIAGAVFLTAVATLTVAAVALLGPLEHGLRNQEKNTLQREMRGQLRIFKDLELCDIGPTGPESEALKTRQKQLARRIGNGTVLVLGGGRPDGQGAQPLLPPGGQAEDAEDNFSDVAQAFRTGEPVQSFGTIAGTENAREALPFTQACPAPTGQTEFVLAVRRSIAEIPDVVRAVNRAFLDAALAALALTIVLGIPLSWRLVRRLRRLREAALAIEHDTEQAPVPVDAARDEVGDLARALASMQGRLRQQEQARRSFVATASHELRTPLASLDGMLELLDEDLQEPTPDVHDARVLLERHDAAPVWALGDPGSVARILRILLDNAVRASPPGTRVTVLLDHADDARINVSDEGPGVAADERESIFDRFSRGRATAGQAGFGLGLAIGRELARRMGGDLVLEPASGTGASFTVHLPAARAPDGRPVPVA